MPLWLGASILPLLSVSLVWSAFSNFLSWRHTQLLAGAVGGLALLMLRLMATNARGTSAGRTPMAVTMFAMISMSLLAWMSNHAQIWHGAMVVLMLSGVTAWLWYPPEFFSPFRAAAHASIALAIAILVPFYAELLGISPWHHALEDASTHRLLRGAFDQSRTLSTASFLTAMSLIVAAWPNPNVPQLSRRIAQAMLVLLSLTALLWISPIFFSARLSIALVALIGVFWRPRRDPEDASTSRRYRWGSIVAVFGVLIVFTLPPVLSQASPYAHTATASSVANAPADDPIPADIEQTMRREEWRSAWQNLPFGAGVGSRTAPSPYGVSSEASGQLERAIHPGQSMLATQMAEQGIMALFVWVLITAGGFLLARLVIIHSNFPPVIAQVLGVTPGITLAFLPGGTQMASALAMVLGWFLLCAPLAQAEERRAQRLVPAPSTPEDERRAPRGRIVLLLMAGMVITWFAVANTRWSREAHLGDVAYASGDFDAAYRHLERANTWLPNASTYLNQALLLEQHTPEATEAIEALYRDAIAHQPNAARIHTAHAQWVLRWHMRASDPNSTLSHTPKSAELRSALHDVELAQRSKPVAQIVPTLRLEVLILLGELEAAEDAYTDALNAAESEAQRQDARLLYARMFLWKLNDPDSAHRFLDAAEAAAENDAQRARIDDERAWWAALERPFTAADFHRGHTH